MLSPALRDHLARYAERHRNPAHRLLVALALPSLSFALIAGLRSIALFAPAGRVVTVAHLGFAALGAWYVSLDARLGLMCVLLGAIAFPVAAVAPRELALTLGVLAAAALVAGRFLEPRRPRAWRPTAGDLAAALVGPLFLVARFLGLWPARVPDPAPETMTIPGGRGVR